MKKILVPTDFSPNALRAVDYAVRIAKLNQASVYIIHACNLDMLAVDDHPSKREYNKTVTDEAFNNLDILRRSIEETEQVLVNIQLYNGPVIDTIILAATEHHADLIIMGTMGITGLKEKIFGSKTAAVIGNSTVPVLAIPLEYDWSLPARYLLAINHFKEVTDILHPVFDLAKLFDAEVRVAVFIDEDKAAPVDYLANTRDIQFAEDKLIRLYSGIAIKADHLYGRHFEDSINDYIDKNQIDMLAMTTHKRSLVGSIFNRSLTRRMSYHAKVPILAIPVNQ